MKSKNSAQRRPIDEVQIQGTTGTKAFDLLERFLRRAWDRERHGNEEDEPEDHGDEH